MTSFLRKASTSPARPAAARSGRSLPSAAALVPALLAAGLAAAPLPARAQRVVPAPAESRFSVTDDLASQEVSENTEIYLDGKLLAHFALDSAHPARRVDATVADGFDRHSYALCGEITVRGPGGTTETHEVDSGGYISDVDGRSFQALGASDFTFFYLADPEPGRALTAPLPGRSPFCHPPVS